MKKMTFLLLLAASGMIGLSGADTRFSPVPGSPRQIRIGSVPVIALAENGEGICWIDHVELAELKEK